MFIRQQQDTAACFTPHSHSLSVCLSQVLVQAFLLLFTEGLLIIIILFVIIITYWEQGEVPTPPRIKCRADTVTHLLPLRTTQPSNKSKNIQMIRGMQHTWLHPVHRGSAPKVMQPQNKDTTDRRNRSANKTKPSRKHLMTEPSSQRAIQQILFNI